MTDFIRNILVNATVANATASAAAAASTEAAVKAELAKPVNQIQIPATVTAVPSLATGMAGVEKQRLIKVEIPESTPISAASTVDAGKAQRAARRDVVNARRDKRKAMASTSSSAPSSPMGQTSSYGSSSDTEDELEDKSKKMKTSKTSSLAVVGGLAVSENMKKPSLSSSMPPTPGLLFTPEIDAAGEERLRAMEAQLETLDPDSKEAKKKRRLIRNRMSAQLHRERKKAYVGQLEDQLLEKDRELKLLQEKMAKMMEDTEKLKRLASEVEKTKVLVPTPTQPTPTPSPTPTPTQPTPTIAAKAPTSAPSPAPIAKTAKKADDEIVIKEEPQSWDSPWPLNAAETWDLHGLEDSEITDLETADLLRDFDDPFAGLGLGAEYADLCKPHHEIHAAKKNLAMMAAVMFSVSFFGNSPSFYNVTPGSNFSSTFGANPPKEFSQMSIASRIVACLEKTSWKEFRDVSTWLSARTADAAENKDKTHDKDATDSDETDDEDAGSVRAVASPSAASDVTDSTGSTCGSPSSTIDDCLDDDVTMAETDLIDEFEYPVEDPFGAGAGADWLVDEDDLDKDSHKKEDFFLSDFMLNDFPLTKQQQPQEAVVATKPSTSSSSSSSISSRLYDSLTALWREKNQVLLTVRNDKQQVLQRSVADMSSIREGLQSGNFFTKVFGCSSSGGADQDASVTFLYPMSAFASEPKTLTSEHSRFVAGAVDPMFLEVSCQMNGTVAASQM